MNLYRGLYDFMWQKGDPQDIIPHDSFWAFRWGYQSVRAVHSFRKILDLQEQGYENDSQEVKNAVEKYAADKFACRYGRRGDSEFRAYVGKARQEGVCEKELRSLIRYGDLRKKKDGHIQIRKSIICASAGGVYLFLCTVAILMMSLLIAVASGPVFIKLCLLFGFWTILSGCGLAIFLCAVHPFLIARRIGVFLEELRLSFLRTRQPVGLSVVS